MDNSYLTPEQFKSGNRITESESVQINRLLRGELSAANAYKQVLKKFHDEPELTKLQEMLNDHEEAIAYWQRQMNGQDQFEESSGPWGAVVGTIISTAKLFGQMVSLKALKEGEEHGLNEYRELLEDSNITLEHKNHIRDVFIPLQEKHIYHLDSMLSLQ